VLHVVEPGVDRLRGGGRDPVEDIGGIGHMMERGRGDDGVNVLHELGLVELDPTVVPLRRAPPGSTPSAS
jgi:hypothetical protein